MSVTVRPLRDGELEDLARAVGRHFHEDESDEDVRRRLPVLATCRCVVADDGGRIVGNLGAYQVDISVPGGSLLPCAGVTAVGVSQLYRRRGLLRSMMTAGLDDAVERGQPVAALFASESTIYPRFGFGIAAPMLAYRIDAVGTRFRDPVDPRLVVELDEAGAVTEAAAIHEVVRAGRGGGVGRAVPHLERALLHDPPEHRDGGSSKRRVHVPGRGYAIYRIRDRYEDDSLPSGEVTVLELVATDPEAEQALWQHVCSIDLTTTVLAWYRPPDDALPWLVADPLRLRPRATAPLYVRILDVARCLGARTAMVDDGLVLEVHDPDRDQSGRYRWDVSPEGAACTRTQAAADVALDIGSLAACWLGGTSPVQLAAGRRIEERTPGAVARLARMTAVDRAPWTPWEF